jgi:hypothetical protein
MPVFPRVEGDRLVHTFEGYPPECRLAGVLLPKEMTAEDRAADQALFRADRERWEQAVHRRHCVNEKCPLKS